MRLLQQVLTALPVVLLLLLAVFWWGMHQSVHLLRLQTEQSTAAVLTLVWPAAQLPRLGLMPPAAQGSRDLAAAVPLAEVSRLRAQRATACT